jgi:signal transduction histidine kinase
MSEEAFQRLQRKLQRAEKARVEAEQLLEQKSLQLHEQNLRLSELSQSLERNVVARTKELTEARDVAVAAAKAKSQFVANMSHELRTPLNGVLGMLILLEKTPLSAQQSEYIRAAQDAGNHLLHTINDILDFSKLEANKQALDFVDINLQDFLSRLVEPYKHTAKKRNNALLLAIDNSVPGSLVSDPNCIRQLLTNLISNAIKFTHNGTIWVKVYIDKNKLYFSVKDSGIGMTQIQCKKVFDAFEQADSSTVRKFGGTGLGLSICKDVATLLSGSISVQSKLGQGSEFTIELPLIHSLKNEPENAEAVDSLPNLEDKVFCGQSILLVEDNDINVQIAQQLLKGSNLLVDVASHGQQAVIMIQDKAYDLVLMDFTNACNGRLGSHKIHPSAGPRFSTHSHCCVQCKHTARRYRAVLQSGYASTYTQTVRT